MEQNRRTKRISKTVRLTDRQESAIKQDYFDSGHDGSYSSYIREILLGDLVHPNFRDQLNVMAEAEPNTLADTEVINTGEVVGRDEARLHIQATVLATLMLTIKADPNYQKILRDNKEDFTEMVDGIRGYEYDDRTGTKSPLPGQRPIGRTQ